MNTCKTITLGVCLLTCSFASSAHNYIQDSQLTEYRANTGSSAVWISHEGSDEGLGDVGSSKDTAFGEEGSSRFRFKAGITNHDFTATPGISQVISDLPAHTDFTYALYYCDKKGLNSQTKLYFGVRTVNENASLTGEVIVEASVHNRQLAGAPKGDKKRCFRQVALDFNSGENTQVEIFSLLQVDTTEAIDLSRSLQFRVDEFSLTKKR